MNFPKQRGPRRRSMLGTHREHNVQLLSNHSFKNAKSRLGTHCSSQCDLQLQTDSAPKGIKDNVLHKSKLKCLNNFSNKKKNVSSTFLSYIEIAR